MTAFQDYSMLNGAANIFVTKITISGDDSHRRAFSSLLLLRVGLG